MSIHIRAPGALNQDRFSEAVSAVDDQDHVLHVDLSACIFVDSYSVIELLVIMSRAHRANWRIIVETPSALAMKNYLRGMRLFELMPESVILDVPVPDPLPPGSDQFLPITPIDLAAGEFGIEELCNFAYPQLPRELAEEFIEALAETGSNVVQHAKASEAFASGQRLDVAYRGRRPPRLHLVVGDSGIGIRSSLASAHPEVEEMGEGGRRRRDENSLGQCDRHPRPAWTTCHTDTRTAWYDRVR